MTCEYLSTPRDPKRPGKGLKLCKKGHTFCCFQTCKDFHRHPPLPKPEFHCPYCGTPIDPEDDYCRNCGEGS